MKRLWLCLFAVAQLFFTTCRRENGTSMLAAYRVTDRSNSLYVIEGI